MSIGVFKIVETRGLGRMGRVVRCGSAYFREGGGVITCFKCSRYFIKLPICPIFIQERHLLYHMPEI
jgi:hypothetical protein